MVWLYLPPDAIAHGRLTAGLSGACLDCPSAQEPEVSTSDSTSPSQNIELWVTSSGTPTLRLRSWRGWKTRPWIALLSGITLQTSTADRGAAWWISSMAAIRANRSALPDSSAAIKTHAISGHTSRASSEKSNPASVSSRMSAGIYDWDSNKSTMTFDQWVIALRRDCLRRKKLVRPTSANDSSSWPTARASSANGASQKEVLAGNPKMRLEVSAMLWPTATATDARVKYARSPDKMIRKDRRSVLRTPGLAETVLQPEDFPYSKEDLDLAKQGKPYRTARVHWPTPRAQEPGSTSSDHGLSLNEASKMWATPTARDWKDGTLKETSVPTNGLLSRQAPRTDLGGSASSNTPRTLNPLFVEALMGWPIGWTDCASAVTVLSHWSRLMRSALLRLTQISTSKESEQPCLI